MASGELVLEPFGVRANLGRSFLAKKTLASLIRNKFDLQKLETAQPTQLC